MKTTTKATTMGAAALIALAGCGSGSDVSEGDTVPLADLSKDVDAAMEDAGTGKMTVSSGGQKLNGAFDLSNEPATKISGKGGGQKLNVRDVGGVFYLKAPSPEITQKGKTWVKVDPDSDDPTNKRLGSSLESMTSLTDPVAAIEGAEDVDAKVTKVDGDKVTYEIKLSKEQMAAAAKKQAEAAGDEQAAQMAGQGAQPVTVELVLDGNQRPVKAETTSGKQTLEVTYKDWGDDVSITAPPKKEVGTVEMPTQGGAPSGSGSSGSESSGSESSGSGSPSSS